MALLTSCQHTFQSVAAYEDALGDVETLKVQVHECYSEITKTSNEILSSVKDTYIEKSDMEKIQQDFQTSITQNSKVWHSNDKYRRIIYQCNNKFRHKTGCSTPHLTEFEIKEYFVKAMNQLITEKAEILDNLQLIRTTLCDKADLVKKKESLEEEIAIAVEMTQNIVAENARVAQNQDEYNKKYNSLVERYNKLKEEYDTVCTTISEKDAKYEQMGRFITVLNGQSELITEFDEALWSSLVEKIVVKSKEEVTVVFKDGTEIKVE